MKRAVCMLSLVVLSIVSPAAARAGTGDATVKFGLSVLHNAPTGAACPVSVPAGADGIAVLDAAVAKGCITSYHTTTFAGIGTFVDCLDQVCQLTDGVDPSTDGLATFWCMALNGTATSYGVDGYGAQDGDELDFTYANFVTLLTPLGC